MIARVHRSACEFLFRYSVVLVFIDAALLLLLLLSNGLRTSTEENVENSRMGKKETKCHIECYRCLVCVVSSNRIVPNIHLCIIFGSSFLFSSFVSINVCVCVSTFCAYAHAAHSRWEVKKKTKNHSPLETSFWSTSSMNYVRANAFVYSQNAENIRTQLNSNVHSGVHGPSVFYCSHFCLRELLSKNKTLLIWFCVVPKHQMMKFNVALKHRRAIEIAFFLQMLLACLAYGTIDSNSN